MPSYAHPRPSIATDVVTLRFYEGRLEVLLIERKEAPLGWALPGGFLKVGEPRIELAAAAGVRRDDIDWTLEDCALRELQEEAGVTPFALHQFGAYGAADRDPRGRYVSIAYWTFVHAERCQPKAGSDAKRFEWRPVEQANGLAFDHDRIVADAHQNIRQRRHELGLFLDLMPSVFTYPMFLDAYQPFWEAEHARDRSNLHRKIAALWADAETDEPLTLPAPRGPGAPPKRYDLRKAKAAMKPTR